MEFSRGNCAPFFANGLNASAMNESCLYICSSLSI